MLPNKAKKKRLICVNGYYSILNAVAILRQMNNSDDFENILLISVDKLNKDSLYKFGSFFKEFNLIFITHYERKKGGYSKIKDFLPISFFDEIMVLFKGTYKYLLKQGIDTNSLIIYDEGKETYFDIARSSSYKNKITNIYLTDKTLVLKNNNTKNLIIHDINQSIIKSILSELPNDVILNDNSVVFLSSVHTATQDDNSYNEKDIKTIKLLISKGYNVYYKAHPRNRLKKNSELSNLIDSNNFFIIPTEKNLLIETVLFYNKDKMNFILGEDSSVLYLSYKLFNIPSFSFFPNNFANNIRQIRVLKHLPKFEDFLDSNLSPAEFYEKEIDSLNNNRERFDILQAQIMYLDISNNYLKNQNKILKILAIILVSLLFTWILF